MSSELDQLKIQHEQLRLEKRAVDRKTEDCRTKIIEDSRTAEAEIEKLQLDVDALKEEAAALMAKNKSLESTASSLKIEHEQKKKAQEEEYDTQRRHKQKLQFQESKLCTKKVNIEKKCDPVEIHKLQIEELKSEVEHNKNEFAETEKIYATEMNKLGNIKAKIEFQKKTCNNKVQKQREELLKNEANIINTRLGCRKELFEKDLLLKRLVIDTKRCEKNIPELEASLPMLEKMIKE